MNQTATYHHGERRPTENNGEFATLIKREVLHQHRRGERVNRKLLAWARTAPAKTKAA